MCQNCRQTGGLGGGHRSVSSGLGGRANRASRVQIRHGATGPRLGFSGAEFMGREQVLQVLPAVVGQPGA